MSRYLFTLTIASILSLAFTACSDSGSDAHTDSGINSSNHRLFNLTCTGPTTCTSTAKTYVVNVDGLFIEPTQDFVETCLEKRKTGMVTNSYCNRMYSPGDTESFNASASVIEHILKYGFNPTDADVERRLRAAEKKLSDQSL